MSAHEEEAALRGHGPAPCDHAEPCVPRGSARWCPRCGALWDAGQWHTPLSRAPDSAAIRDRDEMERTLTIVQARSTELVNEVRSLRARLNGWVEVDVGVCNLDLDDPVNDAAIGVLEHSGQRVP